MLEQIAITNNLRNSTNSAKSRSDKQDQGIVILSQEIKGWLSTLPIFSDWLINDKGQYL